jgi:hypothetical protein
LDVPSQSTYIKRIRARERTVEIWKVHGSLDWFLSDDGQIRSYPLSTKIPLNHSPMIVRREKINIVRLIVSHIEQS